MSSRAKVTWLVLVAAAAVLAGGYFVGKNQGWFPTGSIDSKQVAAAIADRYTKIAGQTIEVTCPSIPEQKGKISDCTATRSDTGQSTKVFVTQIDTGGHFTFQPEDASLLIGSGLVPSEPSASPEPQLSAEDAAKQNDKGWVLEDYTAHSDGAGGQDMVARIKNANASTSTGVFTMTLMQGGTVLATWQGVANDVAPEAIVSVTMLTTDTLPAGVKADAMQFQTDTSIATG